MEISEVIEFINQNKENQEFVQTLEQTGVIKPKEVEVIKEKELSDDELYTKFIGKQGLRDKLYNENADKFLAKKLGIEVKDLTDDLRKTEFIPKSKLEEETGKFKNKLIHNELKKDFGEHYEIFKDKVDISKITFEEEELKGYSEQVEGIKTTFSKYFEVKEEETVLGGLKGKSPKNTNKTSEQLYNENLSKAKKGNRDAYSETVKNKINIEN